MQMSMPQPLQPGQSYPDPPAPPHTTVIQQHTPIAPHHGHDPNSAFQFANHTQPNFQSPLPPPASDITPNGRKLSDATPKSSKQPSSAKANRLSKACDSCSIRKVKCDEEGPPCRACRVLDIPCTFQRPSRRRGPPNKHAEAIKRQKLDPNEPKTPRSNASSSPSFSAATQPTQVQHYPPSLRAETICPVELVELLINDYFTYIQPIKPFPHEPWFRDCFRRRLDISDRRFLALLAAVVGAVVASYPRRPRKHLKELGLGAMFPTSIEFISKCQNVIFECRGPGFLQSGDLNIHDAVTSYLLMAMYAHTYRMGERELFLGETFSIIRMLGYHRRLDPTKMPANKIEYEIGKRLYWTVFVTVRTSTAFTDDSSVVDTIIAPTTPMRPHPELPAEIDDQFIHHDRLEPQPYGVPSRLQAFNTKMRVYLTHDPSIAMELASGIDHSYDRNRQMQILAECLERVKQVFQMFPDHVTVWSAPASQSSPAESPTMGMDQDYIPAGEANGDLYSRGSSFGDAGPRQMIAYEIQKAGLHASYLSTRSYFVERYWSLRNAVLAAGETPSASEMGYLVDEREYRAEHNSIARDLLTMLSSIRPVHLEPNAFPFCMQIRQIASTLIPAVKPSFTGGNDENLHGLSDSVAQHYISQFVKVLMGLEKGGINGGVGGENNGKDGNGHDMDEEEGLRRWADLRQNQRDFVQRGGLGQ